MNSLWPPGSKQENEANRDKTTSGNRDRFLLTHLDHLESAVPEAILRTCCLYKPTASHVHFSQVEQDFCHLNSRLLYNIEYNECWVDNCRFNHQLFVTYQTTQQHELRAWRNNNIQTDTDVVSVFIELVGIWGRATSMNRGLKQNPGAEAGNGRLLTVRRALRIRPDHSRNWR